MQGEHAAEWQRLGHKDPVLYRRVRCVLKHAELKQESSDRTGTLAWSIEKDKCEGHVVILRAQSLKGHHVSVSALPEWPCSCESPRACWGLSPQCSVKFIGKAAGCSPSHGLLLEHFIPSHERIASPFCSARKLSRFLAVA